MEGSADAFAPLAILQIPSPSRFVASACCPDKDLVVLISRLGGEDRLSLWNYNHGSKIWEVDAGRAADGTNVAEIVGLAWSPDGQSVAVVHDPPQITLHSLQDGHKLAALPIAEPFSSQPCRITGVWWFRKEKPTTTGSIPDIFRRGGAITGTAHSILKTLPLLDGLQEDSQKMTATDLFAFQGSQTRIASKSHSPEVIEAWPTLPLDLLAASINSSSHRNSTAPGSTGFEDDVDDSNVNSILAVIDDHGRMHCFLDGSFPLGNVDIGPNLSTVCLSKDPKRPILFSHPSTGADASTVTALRPVIIDVPLLGERYVRDLAKLSSTARELSWYMLRVAEEIRTAWCGNESFTGAREFGPKWCVALKAKQANDFGQEDPNPILDLTALLVTGRASDALADFLGSDEQISERGIQKWETTVGEGLTKLRDFSEKRLAPACQRLHLVMEELHGCAQLPEYALFEIPIEEVSKCLEHLERAIVIAAWLAATARRDLLHFREFISWLRFETSSANASDNTPTHKYDILEVNGYFTTGIHGNGIDKFFNGPVPHFSKRDLGVPGLGDESDGPVSVAAALERVVTVINGPKPKGFRVAPMYSVDRNIDALISEIVPICRRVFDRAAGAASRSATISSGIPLSPPLPVPSLRLFVKERTGILTEGSVTTQHLAVILPSEQNLSLCIVRLRFDTEASERLSTIDVVLLERGLPTGEEFDLSEADFFDDESIVIAYRLRGTDRPAYLATFNYPDLGYLTLPFDGYSKVSTREELIHEVIGHWNQGNLPSVPIPIKRCRVLNHFPIGPVSLALNGRVGRRVACVLDSRGTTMESFDLEEGEDVEEDVETIENASFS